MRSVVAAATLAVLALAGCDANGEMARRGRIKPFEGLATSAGITHAWRSPVPGTVARDAPDLPGAEGAAAFPLDVTPALLAEGRRHFDVFCAPCHSRTGDGDGMVVRRGFSRPPSLHIDRLRQAPVSHVYAVASEGFGAMPGYANQIPRAERWAIVAYVRALQWSRHAPVAALPPDARARLDEAPSR